MLKSNNVRDNITNKVAGAFYGFAIGDAMGATTEFMTEREVHRAFKSGKLSDIIGGGWLKLKPGQVTDDTEMMLCVADGYRASVASGSDFVAEVSKRFVKWYESGPVDCGNACAAGIARIVSSKGVEYDPNVLGNGALMRALPMAIVDRIGLNMIQADMTHCNAKQHSFIAQYHDMVVRQIYGSPFGSEIAWRPNGFYTDLDNPTGHVANTLYNAIKWIQAGGTFEDTIVGAVNAGGDADTIAAIAGGLAGAKYGFDHIPERWIFQLDKTVQHRLAKTVEFFVGCCIHRHAEKNEIGGAKVGR